MKFKKLVSLVSAISVFASLSSVGFSANAEQASASNYEGRPVYTREYNVAQNKPVTVSQNENCTFVSYLGTTKQPTLSLSDVVDDDWKTDVRSDIGTGNTAEAKAKTAHDHWLQVDLQKRYVINSVQIAAVCNNGEHWMSGYEIQASNDENFGAYDVLYTVTAENKLTQNQTPFNLGGKGNINVYKGSANGKAYRYVRLFAKEHCMGISELKVFANQTLTDISTGNKTAVGTRTSNDLQTSTALFREANAWNGGENGYPWMRVDLGAEYPVGAIELTGGDADSRNRRYTAFYGSNVESTVTTDEKTPFGTNALTNKTAAELYDNDNYTKLTDIKENTAYANGYQEFPAPANDGSAFMKASVQDTKSFRYITYKRTYADQPTMLKNMRIMVINPVVNSVKYNNGAVTLEFNDKMLNTSVAGKIKVTSNSKDVAISNLNVNDYEVSFNVDNASAGSDLEITVDKSVTNIYGVPMAENYTASIKAMDVSGYSFDKTAYAANGTATVSATIKSQTQTGTPVVLFAAIKDADGMLKKVVLDKKTIETANVPVNLSAAIAIPAEWTTGWTVEAYLWNETTLQPYADKIFVSQN